MTLVYREEKKEVFEPNREQLGPGYYSSSQSPKACSNTIPFNSAIQRNLFQQPEISVGPGLYQIGSKIISSKNPSSCSFKSQIQRFKHAAQNILQIQQKPSLQLKVGLNDFQQFSNSEKAESSLKRIHMANKVCKIDERLKNIKTIPSIPTIKESFGYQMDSNDELVLNKNPREVMSKLDLIRNKRKIAEPKGVSWSKSKQIRKPFQISQNGFYFQNARVPWDSKAFKYCQSKQISSQNRKLALLKLRYGQKFREYYDESNQDDWIQKKVVENNPGPGHYSNMNSYSSKTIKQKSSCFGSNAERFDYNKLLGKQANIPQTTKHLKSTSSLNQRQQQKQMLRFTNLPTAQRFQIVTNNIPGPGYYQDKSQLKQSTKFGKQGRFLQKKTNQMPGPGYYVQTNSKVSNFQKFKNIKKTKQPLIEQNKSLKDKQNLGFMIGSSDNLQSPLIQSNSSFKPKRIYNFHESFQSMKKALEQTLPSSQNANMQILNSQSKIKGKLQKPKITVNKPKQQVQNIGPGFYYRELPYGKSTFNVTYT